MSEENVEVLRTAYGQATTQGVEGILDLTTEDIVWISDPRFPGGGTQRGKENVRRWLNTIWIWEEVSIHVEEIIDLDDRALGIARWRATPADGPKVDFLLCHLASFRDGLISQAQIFLDRADALEAAGLSE
jgi:ketosteroid isomerase-like protein